MFSFIYENIALKVQGHIFTYFTHTYLQKKNSLQTVKKKFPLGLSVATLYHTLCLPLLGFRS